MDIEKASKKVHKGEARKQIMDTAEALFAQRGVEAVSLRAINSAAGVSPGVLHYHFGSREVLVAELINRHMGTLSESISERLRPLKLQVQPTVSDILKALILPLAELGLQEGSAENHYLGFIVRLHLERAPLLNEVSTRYHEIIDDTYELLNKALPTVEASDIDFRINCACDIALQRLALITERHGDLESGSMYSSDQQQLNRLLDFLAAAIIGIKSN